MIGRVIDRYKQIRKQKFLKKHHRYNCKYAFIGVGNHSISNLYPCIDYLRVPLKYICTRKKINAELMAQRYIDCTGIDEIEIILNDDSIKGVFVCAAPQAHYTIVSKLLKAGKKVFVEKPPCQTYEEFKNLLSIPHGAKNCVVGLQKRYATIYRLLSEDVKQVKSYNYRFLTGSYPEGNAFLDLFIHPIDILFHLFGPAELNGVQRQMIGKDSTIQLMLKHQDVLGMLELSTNYSWKDPKEEFLMLTTKGSYQSLGINHLEFTPNTPNVMGVPLEKAFDLNPSKKILFNNSGFVPVASNNNLYTQGYLPEIESFVSLVEGVEGDVASALSDIEPTYNFIDKLTMNSQ